MLKNSLIQCNKNRVGNVVARVKLAKVELDKVQMKLHKDPLNTSIIHEERVALYAFVCKAKAEELSQRQKSREQRITLRGSNKKNIYKVVQVRRFVNNITCLSDSNGK